jgi:hypothetical protein
MKIADDCDRSVRPLVTAAEVSAALTFVIPSAAEGPAVLFPHPRPLLEVIFDRAYPDFLLRRISKRPLCAAFSEESRMKIANATNLDRKSWGSVVEGPAVLSLRFKGL